MRYFLLLLMLTSLAFAETTITKGTIKGAEGAFPVDQNSRVPSILWFWDEAAQAYRPAGPSSVIFDRMDGQYVTDVSTSLESASGINLTSTFEASGVVIRNFSSNYMKIWFDMNSNPTGASAPDTFWVPSGTSAFFPVNADSVYAVESTTAPELIIEQGRVE